MVGPFDTVWGMKIITFKYKHGIDGGTIWSSVGDENNYIYNKQSIDGGTIWSSVGDENNYIHV